MVNNRWPKHCHFHSRAAPALRAGRIGPAFCDRVKGNETGLCHDGIMNGVAKMPVGGIDGRVDWVDYAKGFCIVFVVMMHSTLGVEAAAGREGWMHAVVEFARPFRMPDFFLISGLFLAQVIDRDWRTYLDRKVVHFFYFYLLWMTIQFVFKASGIAAEHGVVEVARLYALSLIEPFGTLWFIYLLPLFFVFVKLTRRVPWPLIWLAAAALEIAHIETGWMVPDEFAARFVYFYTGYIAARYIFSLTADAQAQPLVALRLPRHLGSVQRRHGARGPRRAAVLLARHGPDRRRRRRHLRPRCWRATTSSRRCAIAAATRSSSISLSFCPWRPAAPCCSRPASLPMSARCR